MVTKNWQPSPEIRKVYPWLSDWQLAKLRRKRLVPFLRLGHRSVLYDLEALTRALRKLEIQEIE